MKNLDEIKALAAARFRSANALFAAGEADDAFYLAGYCVELTLKAKICQRLGLPTLFDPDDQDLKNIPQIGELRKLVMTHNLQFLLTLAGLKFIFDVEKARNRKLMRANSLLLNKWSEQVRYLPCGHASLNEVEKLLNALTGSDGLLQWIHDH